MLYRGYKLGWTLLDVFFPPRCGGCGNWGKRWCASCQDQTRVIQQDICAQCGVPLPGGRTRLCRQCLRAGRGFDTVRSWACFEGPVQNAIHHLKYHRDFGLAERLSRELISLIASWNPVFELVTAVPLDRQRFEERGYNQSVLLARPLAWAFQKPFRERALIRIKHTVPQVGLSRIDRQQNLQGAFRGEGKVVGGCAVLIIDDVITTGATLEASSLALKEAGADRVYGLTLARTMLS